MSEIKPWGYIHPEVEKILRDKAAYNTCITKKRAGHNTIPLYTASQLAEAVAAERERIVAEFQAECKMFSETSNPIDLGKTEVTKAIHAAIRSTTK